MQNYGEFLPLALGTATNPDLYKLGHKLDLFPFGHSYDAGIEMAVKNQTHVLVETYSYLMSVRKTYKVIKETYLLQDQVKYLTI